MKDMKDMIYLIQPLGYMHLIESIINSILIEKYPTTLLNIQQHYYKRKTLSTNIYFIINDPNFPFDGLKLSKTIRLNEPNAIIILATTELDYTKFFRTHIGFFGVINLKNTNKTEIEDYLKDSLKILEKSS